MYFELQMYVVTNQAKFSILGESNSVVAKVLLQNKGTWC